MKTPTRRAVAALVLVASLGTACQTGRAGVPNLGDLYNDVARYHDELSNPIIVIPGILGSKLTHPDLERTVWGAFGGNAANPKRAGGAQLVSLPMREGAELRDLRDDVVPDGVLETIKVKMAGLPFQLKAYLQILTTLGAGGYRDETFAGAIDYGEEHFTCFQFDYDWRRDNVENAQRLHEFILAKRQYVMEEQRRRFGKANPDLKFDVIAHSMGGLLLRYYLRYGGEDLPPDGSVPAVTWEGSKHVDRAILVGTPNAGALDSLSQLVEGRKFGPLTPRYEPALLGTFPSAFQLLPRRRHGALIEASAQGREPVDVLDPEVWITNGWGLADPEQESVLQMLLPDVRNAADRRRIALDHLRKSLARARRVHAALDLPAEPPPGTSLYLMAGDAVSTPSVATANRAKGRLDYVEHGAGDGTVLRSSALMDERVGSRWQPRLRSPITWSDVMFLFSSHLGMTKDPSFSDNVLFLLLEDPRSGSSRQESGKDG